MKIGEAKRRNKGFENTIVVGVSNDEFSGIGTRLCRQRRAKATMFGCKGKGNSGIIRLFNTESSGFNMAY